MYVEVIECENIFTTQLTPKLLDNNLQTVKSQENLVASGSGNSGGTESETNSQINFNIQESTSQEVAPSSSPPKSKPVEPITAPIISKPDSNGLFDQNNFDRWSISSDVGPINGNNYFRVSY